MKGGSYETGVFATVRRYGGRSGEVATLAPKRARKHTVPPPEVSCVGLVRSGRRAVLSATAGYPRKNRRSCEQAEKVEIDGFDGREDIFRMKDDGMAPTITSGEHLLCTKVRGVDDLHSGNVVIVETATERVVKRLQYADGKILLQSDNSKYKIYKLDTEEVVSLWRVERKLSLADLQTAGNRGNLDYLEQDLQRIREQLELLKAKLRSDQ